MNRLLQPRLAAVLAGVLLAGCQPSTDRQEAAPAPEANASSAAVPAAKLVPLPGKEGTVPAITQVTTVRLATTGGDVVIEVYPQAAPNAAQRFVELAQTGFFNDTPVSRVVAGFVAQFGINWRSPHRAWETRLFRDDPTLFALERGTLAFAKAGADTNSTQVFINYRENNRLADPQYNFTVFGKVVSGMDVVDRFVQVGDPSGGLDQNRLWADGEAYLASLTVKPTMILTATVVE
jgi:cyclophilin family peptidyl-prolyl cis-trans isomerase